MVNEICILQRLSDASSACLHPGSAHILSLVDHFTISGPNGAHHVLATEIAGPRLSDLVMPSAVVRELCRQLVEGVDYLHQQVLRMVVSNTDSGERSSLVSVCYRW